MTPTVERVKAILDDLDSVQENLLALSDDIWLDIDHTDNEAIAKGARFKQEYNDKLTDFGRLSGEIRQLVEAYVSQSFQVAGPGELGTEELKPAVNQKEREYRERQIQALDEFTPHYLDEPMTWKRPQGFAMRDNVVSDATTWKKILVALCRQLHKIDAVRFEALPTNPAFVSNRGNPRFDRAPDQMISPRLIANGIYTETNLSAQHICETIRKLLREFKIGVREFKIYLREDRDA